MENGVGRPAARFACLSVAKGREIGCARDVRMCCHRCRSECLRSQPEKVLSGQNDIYRSAVRHFCSVRFGFLLKGLVSAACPHQVMMSLDRNVESAVLNTAKPKHNDSQTLTNVQNVRICLV